ncbi:MAG: PTS sugar transporter subunit IIA [Nitrospirae bacterium]|nr:PTS sugar transporter subunit IIA [Nitrospirota bacterium]MBI5696216.1 PTS sugar transporter subunit IIA [Nitrospirota bacterium]
MKMTDLLDHDLIIDEFKGETKLDVLQEFSALLFDRKLIDDKEGLTKVLAAREALGSTGVGDGVAIPHGKLGGLDRLLLAFGRSRKGIDFDSLDGRPAHIFFLIIAPDDAPGEHLRALARISRMMKSGELRDSLMKARGMDELKMVISEADGR